MGFANYYLEKHKFYPAKISPLPDKNLDLIVVIPCYNEPDLISSLKSLWNCKRPFSSVEVIIVINSPENSTQKVIQQNQQTLNETQQWIKSLNITDKSFQFHIIYKPDLRAKYAGVGLARKIGMDEAMHRFNYLNNENGIIVSFDADSTCEPDFLSEIENQFKKYPETNACSIYFEHPIDGSEFSPEIYKGIAQYELYLRYYIQGLRFSTFPYAYHTIGSCFAVKATIYAKQGGMNRKKAGEDFYFLQKVIPLGNFYEINSTKIIPSSRASDRVPFGTGAMIKKYLNNYSTDYFTYNPQVFIDLKIFFTQINKLYNIGINKQNYEKFIADLPEPIRAFLNKNNFYEVLIEVNNKTKTYKTFIKRFFHKFNAFKILKYMNFAHEKFYSKIPIVDAATNMLSLSELYSELSVAFATDRIPQGSPSYELNELLKIYRDIQMRSKK